MSNWISFDGGWLSGLYDYTTTLTPIVPTSLIPIATKSIQETPTEQHFTMLLDPVSHDIMLDANGNMALCAQPYAVAQDVATAILLDLGELWYDTAKGMPFTLKIASKALSMGQLIKYIEDASMTVPDVVQAVCTIESFVKRNVKGQILVTDTNGQKFGVRL